MSSLSERLAMHNGPVCATCGRGYISAHSCNPADLLRKAADLIDTARGLQAHERTMQRAVADPVDRTAGCPCRPENGGSGICGCIMGGVQITC